MAGINESTTNKGREKLLLSGFPYSALNTSIGRRRSAPTLAAIPASTETPALASGAAARIQARQLQAISIPRVSASHCGDYCASVLATLIAARLTRLRCRSRRL